MAPSSSSPPPATCEPSEPQSYSSSPSKSEALSSALMIWSPPLFSKSIPRHLSFSDDVRSSRQSAPVKCQIPEGPGIDEVVLQLFQACKMHIRAHDWWCPVSDRPSALYASRQHYPVTEDIKAPDDNDNDNDGTYSDLPPLSEPEDVVERFWATSPEGMTTAYYIRAFSEYQKRTYRAASSRTVH